MTNSIVSAKCPSVLTSGKYGMSQHRSIIDDSKEYIFVKLTDSAFRAIEEYQRNAQSKRLQKGQCAKIQFIGNAGVIHFPPAAADGSSANGPADGRKFGFAIDDVEGSLECIQQSSDDLDVLGSINYRMRIHANDDVYDTTRTKMAIAEETEKSKCIREIKPNQTDIGRKVKRPVSAASIQAYTNGTTSSINGTSNGSVNSISNSINGSSSYLGNSNNNNHSGNNNNSRNKLSTTLNQHSPPSGNAIGGGGINGSRLLLSASLRSSPNHSLMGGSGTVGGSGNVNNRYGSPSNLSSNLPSLSSIGGNSPPVSGLNLNSNNHMPVQQNKGTAGNGANKRGNGSLTSVGKGGKTNSVSNGKTLDVSRRKIRERLIHLLALKPFKKPELYSRLQNEGLAQRERQLISTILKDISTLSRDNTYNLRRSMWNDVDENWPFFSEQEIQQLKRRKPQNLTPPMSSDAGSSTSGQSPTSSTHAGSPPPLVGAGSITHNVINGGGSGLKRTSLEPDTYDGALSLGVQSKKQRISHYRKDGSNSSIVTNSNNLAACARLGMGINGGIGNSIAGGRNAHNGSTYNHSQRSSSTAYSPHNYNTNNNDENSGNSDLTFNVLNNMDDFIQHTAEVGGDHSFTGRNKTMSSSNSRILNTSVNGGNNSSTTPLTLKEKRNSAGSTSSSSGYSSNRESSSTSSTAMRCKNSPTPYANNFVPESKISLNTNGSSSNNRLKQSHQIQRQHLQSSPNYNNNSSSHHSHKSVTNHTNNSVIPNISEDYTTVPPPLVHSHTTTNHNTSSNRSRHHLSSSNAISNSRIGEPSNKHSRSSTPTQKHYSKHNKQLQNNQHQHQSQEDLQQALYGNVVHTPPQTASHSSHQQQQAQQQQEHSSPTQQIAAAASTFSFANDYSILSFDAPRYDFSSYTPITSIEQRRKYKTEFESDYDEYRKLLVQIESVGRRFRKLADRLNHVKQGCSDYYNIKDQIVSEYNRIREEVTINRDKQRFDYLHEKLAHIKQLVMDYDKKLTSGMVVTTTAANRQHQQQQQELQYQQQTITTVTNNSAHLSPMLQSSGESNHSPPLVVMNSNNTALPKSSSSHTRKNSKHYQKNYQQEPDGRENHYQQHHDPETIQIDEETSLQQYHSYNGNDNTGGNNFNRQHQKQQQQQQFHISPPANFPLLSSSTKRKFQQQQHNNEEQQLQNHVNNSNHNNYANNNDSDSDSGSSSSSSSNDDDNSDDEISDASGDDDDDDGNSDDDNNDQ